MKRYLPLVVGTVLLAASGVVHGLWTDRWTTSAAVEKATARLETVPWTVGEWVAHPQELDARQLAISEAAGHLARRYVHKRSGHEVSLIVLCGRSGPLSVHRPDVCYTGSGYQLAAEPEKWSMPEATAAGQFWTARFHPAGNEAASLRVFWAWSPSGDWVAAERLTFARAPALYKFYLVQSLPRPDEPIEQGAAHDFLQVMLPELKRCLGTTETPQ